MKYYLVATTTCCMVGIEQCLVYRVSRRQQAVFQQQFAGRILQVATSRQVLPPAPYRIYQ